MAFPHVVRIFVAAQEPDYDCPWQSMAPESATGSGVLIGKNRVLTGAHVVADATFIMCQRQENPDKVPARVRSICHDADLAVLEVEDEDFGDGLEPVEFGGLPALRDAVSVVGFPVGGEEISITEGVVSRIEVQTYAHSQRKLLAVTVDAAINAGNSGGPVFQGDRVVGIAFQKLDEAEGIGEMVPTPLIGQFLLHAETASVRAIPGLGVSCQNLENPFLRDRLGMGEKETGILVRSVDYGSSADGVLAPGDVLLELAGHRVANNGTTRLGGRYRTHYSVVLGGHEIGDKMAVRFLRDGIHHDVELTLRPHVNLVPRARYDVAPSYLVYGGLVFQPLTRDFLGTWERWEERAPTALIDAYENGVRTEERREVVVLSRVLADRVNIGYESFDCEVVTEVNGAKVKDLATLARLLDSADAEVCVKTAAGGRIDLDVEAVRASHARILKRYRIPRDRSADLDRP